MMLVTFQVVIKYVCFRRIFFNIYQSVSFACEYNKWHCSHFILFIGCNNLVGKKRHTVNNLLVLSSNTKQNSVVIVNYYVCTNKWNKQFSTNLYQERLVCSTSPTIPFLRRLDWNMLWIHAFATQRTRIVIHNEIILQRNLKPNARIKWIAAYQMRLIALNQQYISKWLEGNIFVSYDHLIQDGTRFQTKVQLFRVSRNWRY